MTAAIGPETALLLKVHPSNYRVVGFTSEVTLEELVKIGRARGIPVMEDLGAGALDRHERIWTSARADRCASESPPAPSW